VENLPPVSRALTALNIPHRVFRHPGPVLSLEQAAAERGQTPEQVVRSIVFRAAQDEFVMVLVAGDQQVNWPALRRYLGQSRVSLASEAEVLDATGCVRGTVAPFGLPAPMRIILDESVLQQGEVSLGSGERGVAVIVRVDDLRRALGEARADVARLTAGNFD
jgi:Cys-tRNA(Pro) deacylase